jgi:hypothetical protein
MISPPPGIPTRWRDQDGKVFQFRFAWDYCDTAGTVLGRVARFDNAEDKAVIPFFGNNGKSQAPPEPRPLFGLDTLKDPRADVSICEGEKAAAAMHLLGLPCVTSLGGSQAASKSDWMPLQGLARVCIIPDNDTPGEDYAKAVAGILAALPGGREIKIARLPGLPKAGDAVDWIQARCEGWDGYAPIPRDVREDLQSELRDAINGCAEALPPEWLTAAAPAVEDWEPPVSLDAAIIPPWPTNIFPPDVQAFVDALSKSTETPPELASMMTIAVLGVAAQGKFRVRIKTDYVEPLSLWTCCALQSGNRKTAVWQAATAPLSQWERERRTELEPNIEHAQSDVKTLQSRVDALRTRAAKAKDPHDVGILRQEIKDTEALMPDVPVLPQVWAADVTPENLAVIMAENHECMSLLSDEGGMLDMFAGRYSNGIPNLDVYLQGHAGSPVRVNRGSRAAVFLERPALTIGICPQPDVVRALADKPGFRGRGLLARFLYAMPVSNLGRRTGNAPPLPDHVRDGYSDTVRAMLARDWNVDAEGRPCAHVLKLAPEAFAAWTAFVNQNEGGMAEGGTYSHITDWASKACCSQCPRFPVGTPHWV